MRGLMILAGLLVVSLGWAYQVTHTDSQGPSSERSQANVWQVSPRQVERIEYRTDTLEVVLEPSWPDGAENPRIWVRETRRPKTDKVPQPVPLVHAYKGSREAERLVEWASDLKAERAIGKLAQLSAEGFGLPAENNVIRVVLRGEAQPKQLEMGELNFAHTLRYVRDRDTDRVFLVQQNAMQSFIRGRNALMDKRLLEFRMGKAERLVIRSGNQETTLWNLDPTGTGQGEWSNIKEGKPTDPAVEEFTGNLEKLRAEGYAAPGDAPPEGPANLEILFHLSGSGAPSDSLKIFAGPQGLPQAQSAHTGVPAQVSGSTAKALLEAAQKLVSAK